jgi:hypothetical protein
MLSVEFYFYVSFSLFVAMHVLLGVVLLAFSFSLSAFFSDVRIPIKLLILCTYLPLVLLNIFPIRQIYAWDEEKKVYPNIKYHYIFQGLPQFQIIRLKDIFCNSYRYWGSEGEVKRFVDWNILKEELYHKIRNDQGVLQLIAIGLLSHFLAW